MVLTINSNVVWLNMGFLDFAVLNDQGIALASISSEDG